MKLSEIKPNPDNPRIIRDEHFAKLKKSIQEFPQMMEKRPIVVDENNMILGGNMRFRALQDIYGKDGDIPDNWITIAKDWTDEQKREFVIKDNVAFGEWDWTALANEWNAADLNDWAVDLPEGFGIPIAEPEAKDDDFDENEDPVETICKPGEMWKLGEHRLLCGDSTKPEDVEKLMMGELADLWITDPPYNVAVQNSQNMTILNDNMKSDEFRSFLRDAFFAANKVLTKGCPFYIWFASKEHINFEGALNDNGLIVRQELIWNKNHFILGRAHYQWKHEPCLYGWKGDSCRFFIDSRNQASVYSDEMDINISKMKKPELQKLLHDILQGDTPTTVLDYMKPNKDTEHPTMKPVRLFGYQISNSSKAGDVVLDTFGGSGTTIIACEQLYRKARLIELDPHYCDVIIARWEKFTAKKAVKIES